MEYMFQAGFLGTRAPFFMDVFVVIVSLLPFLIGLAIWFSINRYYKLHRFFQTLLFLITVIVLIYFEYGMHKSGGFSEYMKSSSVDPKLALYFLIFHIIIASIALLMWGYIMRFAVSDRKRRALPGLYSSSHKKSGRRVAFLILLTSITGAGVYWMLFIG